MQTLQVQTTSAIGAEALESNVTGNDNAAVCRQSLEQNTGSNNTAVGYTCTFPKHFWHA